VETLIERGFRVFALNPKQLDRFRDRFFPSGAKDDSKDAFVLGHCLRTDRSCYREACLDEPSIIRLRELGRMHEELKQERNRLANRVRDLLVRYFPDLLRVADDADEPWLLELLERAPTPERARRLHRGTVAKVLRKHRIRRLDPEQVLKALRAPPLELAEGSVEAASTHVLMLIPRIRLVHQQKRDVEKQLRSLLGSLGDDETTDGDGDEDRSEHRDAEIILSMPGAGTIITATVLAEASQAIRERDYHSLRMHTGVAPVTKQTGKQKHGKRGRRRPRVIMRQGCNGRLRDAMYNWARVASIHDAASHRYYADLRARGHSHGRALRSVGDRLLRILVAMLRDRTLYDASRFEEPVVQRAA
jgi:transposase